MTSLNDASFKTESIRVEENNCARRLQCPLNFFVKYRELGLYYVASMLFIVNAICTWRFLNIVYSFESARRNYHFFSPALKDWTLTDYQTFHYGDFGGQICVQVPAALLIYLTSSHKFLTAAVAISSILHMLTPTVVNMYPRSLVPMLYIHSMVQAPLRIAVLSMWKDWARSGEQTKFVFFSFSSLILGFPFSTFLSYLSEFCGKEESFYISGAFGLGWSFLWFFTLSETPERYLQCSQHGQLCQHNNAIFAFTNRQKLSELPWKSIVTSKPVFALCLVYYKIGGSFVILFTMISMFASKLDIADYLQFTYFNIIFAVLYAVILFSSAITIDFLIRKYPRIFKTIRKGILCEVLFIHGILLLGTLFNHIIPKAVFMCLSYFIFSMSLAGFITNALELSRQYVAIIGGFIETFYLLGVFLSQCYMIYFYKYLEEQKDKNPLGKIFLYEVAVTIFVAAVFLVWGSFEEQKWSMSSTTCSRSTNAEVHPISEDSELREQIFNT